VVPKEINTIKNSVTRKRLLVAGLILLPIIVAIISLYLGRYGVSPWEGIKIMLSQVFPIDQTWTDVQESVIINLRFPRILLGMLVGGGLAISGASFQGMFRNPLVSPDILGVSAGAGFGACVGILIANESLLIQTMAFASGLLAVLLAYTVSRTKRGTSILMLVLSGVIAQAFFTALIGITKYVADPEEQLPAIVYWLLGSLSGTSYTDLLWGAPPILLGTIILLMLRWRINLLSLGDEEAQALGINTKATRWIIIIAATVITASSVALCGMVGWIGLVIPHMGRMLVGPNHKVLLPTCFSLGALALVVIDDVARAATAQEIPLSILTAIIGAPFFAYLLRRTGGKWAQ
jgi:iron complex transport system permease protein